MHFANKTDCKLKDGYREGQRGSRLLFSQKGYVPL